ncbi:MAG TPA: hypothetical protein VFG30_25490 [Polyangiales bacterium]|nr:hypothetical protein [Polyangiales bacterium]
MRLLVIPAFSIALIGSVLASRAAAGGLEYSGAGAQALGRGGAVVAKADDPMVLANNPAGLAELRGNHLMLDINLALMSACVDPIGYYGWGVYGGGTPIRIPDPNGGPPTTLNLGTPGAVDSFYTEPLDTVCMKQGVTPVPQFGITARVSERLGIGFGLMFPAAQPQGAWGDQNGVIQGKQGLRPVPTRYMMINSGTIGLFPTVGLGFRVTDWLRIGAAFEWGIINVDNLSMAVVSPGTSPAQDILARVKATDWFIPAVNASVHLVPIDALDIVAAFRWQDQLNAPGNIDLTTGVFDVRAVPRTKRNVVDGVHQHLPSKITGAIRYADRLVPRPSGSGQGEVNDRSRGLSDPFRNERWDVEVDAEYLMSDGNRELRVDYQENQTIEAETIAGMISTVKFPDVPRMSETNTDTVIQKRWKNQLSLRAGSSINVIPGVFGFSVGAHYETRGVDPDFMQIDYWPLSRVGLHAGVKFRISGTIDITASYAHIFQETLVTGAPQDEPGAMSYEKYAQTGEVTTIDKRVGAVARGTVQTPLEEPNPNAKRDGTARLAQYVTKSVDGRPPWIVNSGTYRSNFNVFAAGVNVHF